MIYGELLDGRTSCHSVLILGSGRSSGLTELVDVGSPSRTPLLVISFSPQVSSDIDYWQDFLGFRPPDLTVITTDSATGTPNTEDTVSHVSAPSDMTGIGMQATEQLASWDDESGLRPLVVVDSLTILLQYVSVKSLYRFLHALTVRLDASGARGLFFLDPQTQDDKTVYTFASLFDAIAERDEETGAEESSEWSIRSR
ncbi:hypothetical protein [Haloferax sp. DFSO60]|uniref:DUF7504 family protein n=1 Tax=Haloferax sp. DFSO60 TaxID=3388652 RepID=UPI003979E96D